MRRWIIEKLTRDTRQIASLDSGGVSPLSWAETVIKMREDMMDEDALQSSILQTDPPVSVFPLGY